MQSDIEIKSSSHAIAVIDEVLRRLTETTDLGQIKRFRDQAEAVRHFAKTAALSLEMQNQAAEAKLFAERRAGELLRNMRLRGGDRKSCHRRRRRLADLGVSKEQSARWQSEASLSEEEFRNYLQRTKEEGKELTSQAVLRLARLRGGKTAALRESLSAKLAAGLRRLADERSQFRCIHVVPPWPEKRRGKAAIGRFVQDLLELPVQTVAAEGAHLHLRTPPDLLDEGLRLLQAWGFSFKASLVLAKPPTDYGRYWRQAHEVLLLGVRGTLEFRDVSLPSWRNGRAASPQEGLDEVRTLIERASFAPYLQIFGSGDNVAKGWKMLSL